MGVFDTLRPWRIVVGETVTTKGSREALVEGLGAGPATALMGPQAGGEESEGSDMPTSMQGKRSARDGGAPDNGAIRVMIVDDHKIVREGLQGILGDVEGIEVVAEASDGRQAMEQLEQVPTDVVIMDVSMPGMDGLEATRRIASERPRVRVIGLSMHEKNEMAEAMVDAGAVTYLTKGGPSSGLVEAIQRAGGH